MLNVSTPPSPSPRETHGNVRKRRNRTDLYLGLSHSIAIHLKPSCRSGKQSICVVFGYQTSQSGWSEDGLPSTRFVMVCCLTAPLLTLKGQYRRKCGTLANVAFQCFTVELAGVSQMHLRVLQWDKYYHGDCVPDLASWRGTFFTHCLLHVRTHPSHWACCFTCTGTPCPVESAQILWVLRLNPEAVANYSILMLAIFVTSRIWSANGWFYPTMELFSEIGTAYRTM